MEAFEELYCRFSALELLVLSPWRSNLIRRRS